MYDSQGVRALGVVEASLDQPPIEKEKSVVFLENVSKTFRRKKALHPISLSVTSGEFVAVMGKSGSGKSTLLNLIGLLDRPDAGGSIMLFGKPAPKTGSLEARKLLQYKIGYLFQNAALIDQDSVEDNLKLAQKYSVSPKASHAIDREAALFTVGLADAEKQSMSGAAVVKTINCSTRFLY